MRTIGSRCTFVPLKSVASHDTSLDSCTVRARVRTYCLLTTVKLLPKAALCDAPWLTTSDLELNQLVAWLLLVLEKMCY